MTYIERSYFLSQFQFKMFLFFFQIQHMAGITYRLQKFIFLSLNHIRMGWDIIKSDYECCFWWKIHFYEGHG